MKIPLRDITSDILHFIVHYKALCALKIIAVHNVGTEYKSTLKKTSPPPPVTETFFFIHPKKLYILSASFFVKHIL